MSDDTSDVVSVFTEQIERLFDMEWEELKAAVAAAPGVYPAATDLVARHSDLIESQRAVYTDFFWPRVEKVSWPHLR